MNAGRPADDVSLELLGEITLPDCPDCEGDSLCPACLMLVQFEAQRLGGNVAVCIETSNE